VPAIQLERLAVEAIRAKAWPDTKPKGGLSDRVAIDRYVTRIIVRPDSIDIELKEPMADPAPSLATNALVTAAAASFTRTKVISLPWSAPAFPSVKGVVQQPEAKPTLKRETRDAILLAVAKARFLDQRHRIWPHSIVRRDRGARRQGGNGTFAF
jgi:hypothetical protein